MKSKIIYLIFFFLMIVLLMTTFLIFPKMVELRVEARIDKANYCELDSDCVDAGSKCPFGCYNYVNKDEVENISRLLQAYNSKCVYDCVGGVDVICKNNKCLEQFNR